MKYKLIMFDLDGTLTEPKSGERFPKTIDDRRILPGREEKLLELSQNGIKMCIITNQGGAAWGIIDAVEMSDFLFSFCNQLQIDYFFVCYRDTSEKARISPKTIKELTETDYYKEWDRRKPGPGMIEEGLDHFGIDRFDALFVGDRQEDRDAAENSGVDFQWAWDFFKEGPIMA